MFKVTDLPRHGLPRSAAEPPADWLQEGTVFRGFWIGRDLYSPEFPMAGWAHMLWSDPSTITMSRPARFLADGAPLHMTRTTTLYYVPGFTYEPVDLLTYEVGTKMSRITRYKESLGRGRLLLHPGALRPPGRALEVAVVVLGDASVICFGKES